MLFALQRAKFFTAFGLTRTLTCEQHTPNTLFGGCGKAHVSSFERNLIQGFS
jgi:hypothetical protein